MQMRAKVLTVATAMVTTFAILPTFGAAAAEPLEDGSYDVTVGEQTYTVEVVEGTPVIEDIEGVEFLFAFDEDTGRVLDEFDLTVDGTEYEVEVDDDGTATVTEDTDADTDDTDSDDEVETTDGDDDVEASDEDDEESDADEDDESDDIEAADEAEDDEAHGELVSSVAECAPTGRTARDAGLPNHGFFVSAAARGESVEFEVDGEVLTADLSTQEGADAFCTLATELLESDDTDATGDDEGTADATDGGDEVEPTEAEQDEGGRPDAPGRSGDAPGRAKRGG